MAEIEFPPQDARGSKDPHDESGAMQTAVLAMARDRMHFWVTMVLTALTEFQVNATVHIDQLESEADAHVEFAGVIGALTSVVASVVPGGHEIVKAVSEAVVHVMTEGLQSSYNEHMDSSIKGGKRKLHASIAALVTAETQRATNALAGIEAPLAAAVDEAMTWVDASSNSDEYIRAFVDWMGIPEPTRANTVDPIRQAIESQFFGVYEAVDAQFRDGSPIIWEHEAIQEENRLYKEEGEKAWEDAYKERGTPG